MMRRANVTGRMLLPVVLLVMLVLAYKSTGDAQAQGQAAQPPAAGSCPGQAMPVQATGVYAPTEVPDININGKPAGGAIWQAGMRSFWHCHAGGQIMMLDQGVGRVQKRGERMRTLRRGETEYAPPGVEHWHGAAADSSALYFQTSIGNTTAMWMEEVNYDDYAGNETGITSRNEFLKTGVRNKPEAAKAPAMPAPATPAATAPR